MIKIRSKFCFFLLLSTLVCQVWHLPAQVTDTYDFSARDSLNTILDSVKTGFLLDVRDNQHTPTEVTLSLSSLLPEAGLPIFSYEYKGFGSDLYEVSTALVNAFYSRRILIYQFYNGGYLYLSLKDAQNSKGLLQFRIPFGNLRKLYDKYKRKI